MGGGWVTLIAHRTKTPVELRRQPWNSAGNHGNQGQGFTRPPLPLPRHQLKLTTQWKIILTGPSCQREGGKGAK